jgi:predicted MFS family arabinose efflux permease
LVDAGGLPIDQHWKIYLPVVLVSFILMLPPIFLGEKRGRMKQVFVFSIGLLLLVEIGLRAAIAETHLSFEIVVALLLAFFVAFNILEASQPSLVSRMAPASARGAALGIYNTMQAIGLFAGGAGGGLLAKHYGAPAVFSAGCVVTLAWLIIASSMKHMPRRAQREAAPA